MNKAGNSSVLSNAKYLAIFQMFNYAAPLLLLPFLTRTLSVEEFGVVMVTLSTIILSYVVTDYGFNLSATYSISKDRNNKPYINNLISSIFTAKILLSSVSILLLYSISMLPAYYEYRHVFWVGFIAVIAQAYQPMWFFHGLEKMKIYTIYMSLTKIIYIILALIFVDDIGDGIWVIISWSLANVVGTVISIVMIHKMGYETRFSKLKNAISELKASVQFFWSRVAVALYTSASSIIVGSHSLQEAAMYSAAEQGYKAGQSVTSSISQALFPHMAKEKNWKLFYRLLVIGGAILITGAFVVGYFSIFVITFVFGETYRDAATILVIMMVTLSVNYFSVLFGYPACAAINRPDIANISVIFGSIFFGIVVLLLYFFNSITGVSMAISILVTEVFVLVFRVILVLKNKERT